MKKKCPLCNGCGEIEVEVIIKPSSSELKKAAMRMRKQGYTIRQIAKTLGKKHPGSISHLLSN
jgi:transposase-like protein